MKKSGIINVYKEKGYTSFDVVAILRKTFHIKKIGHTGTLDPDAEGVLPVCFGKATKVCDLLTDKDKVYQAVMRLGITTDTEDMTGQVLEEKPVSCTEEEVQNVIESFVGEQEQIPPMYSALKVNGKKLYELARQGIEVERKSRPIQIFSIQIDAIKLPEVTFTVHCSKGTYIRTLCKDIGEKLGCGACMRSLLRKKVAGFALENALTLEEIRKHYEENTLDSFLSSVDAVFPNTPQVDVYMESQKYACNGAFLEPHNIKRIQIPGLETAKMEDLDGMQSIRVYLEDGVFVGVYEYRDGRLKPRKMFYES